MVQRIYTSSNGDTWDLVRESDPERVRVRHQPNLASGGSTTDYELVSFLSVYHQHPQGQELVKLIGTLADEAPASTSGSSPRVSG